MNKKEVDAVIIGGGPIGIHTAIKLKEAGIDAAVVEADSIVGKPRWCTGVISEGIFEMFGIPKDSIQARLYAARVISPLGTEVYFTNRTMRVCVIDRTAFDQDLYKIAKEKGVKFFLNSYCYSIEVNRENARLSIRTGGEYFDLYAKICVLATGIKYELHEKLGLGQPSYFLDSIQSEFSTKAIDTVEVYLGNNIAPKSFAWAVPVATKTTRIGVTTTSDSYTYLTRLLDSPYLKDRVEKNAGSIMIKRPIPVGTIRKTFSDRLLVVGDAAGQVKPLSGGGIYCGLISSEIAADVIKCAFEYGRFDEKFLSDYEARWKKRIGFELTAGFWLRDFFSNCTDEQIESLIKLCNQGSIIKILENYDFINDHGSLFRTIIKKPAFWSTFYKIYKVLSDDTNLTGIESVIPDKKEVKV